MKAGGFTASQVDSRPRIRLRWGAILVQSTLIIAALAIWWLTLPKVNVKNMTDLGLLTVLPVSFYIAILLITFSFTLANSEDQAYPLMLGIHIAALLLIIHATPQILYGTLRYSWAWKHVGIIDYIQRNGSVDPNAKYLNVYHDWPGFFSFGALLTQVAGLQSALSFAGWAPLFFNLIDLPALLMIFRSLTRDRRLIWLSVWVFYIANWIGQDYFSPQAMSFFLYLTVIGIVLTWLSQLYPYIRSEETQAGFLGGVNRRLSQWMKNAIPEGASASTPSQRAGLILILVLIFFVIASSHQLTPFMLLSALILLVLFQITRARSLPIIMGILTASWIIFMGETFLAGHLDWVTKSIGLLTGNFTANFHNLSQASPGQIIVSWVDRAVTALVWILAVIGFMRRVRNGKWDLAAVLLILAPLPLIAANSYGGEMVFRVYLFALPFLSFFAASTIYSTIWSGQSINAGFASLILSIVLLFGFFFGYYGKEEMYYFSPEEVQAAEFLNNTAPPGSILMSGTPEWLIQFRHYEWYDYLAISDLPHDQQVQLLSDPVTRLLFDMKSNPHAYFVISRSQIAQVDTTGMLPKGTLYNLESILLKSPKFKVVYSNSDTIIFTRAVNP